MNPATFARFAEVLAEATLLVDGHGMVLTANKAATALLGCQSSDLLEQPLTSLTSDGPAAVADLLRIGSRSPQRSLGALSFRVGEGVQVQTHCEVAAIQARSGDQPALISLRLFDRHEVVSRFLLLTQRIEELSKEIVRRREAEAKLESYSAQLIADARRKDEFLAMLSHELRNPLAPMSLGVDLLKSIRSGDPRIDRVAAMMRRQLDHLKRLVDDLLDVARLTHGKIELNRQPVPLEAVLGQAVEMFKPMADERGLRLRFDRQAIQVVIYADTVRLVQVFGNLLSNAVKFSRSGGEILVSARLADDGVVASVRDDGVGISAELLPQIFDMFVQADRSLDRLHGGLGVGLAVVRSVVELHGGRVAASSAGPGQGTEILVWLPVQTTAAAAQALPATADEAAQLGAGGDAAAPKLRVLVVEDNADAAEAMCEILVDWGHDAVSVGDGPSALALWPEWRPDVALCDIGLPGMSGHELARRCRPLGEGRRLLMLALSGYGSAVDVQASRDSGFDEHMVKPVDLDRLESRLASHVAMLLGSPAG